jgi:hypothetical protein
MVYYDWNIDNFGFIWSGFLHKFEGETTDQAVPYNRVDVEGFPDIADDPEVSKGVYFNEDAKEIEDSVRTTALLEDHLDFLTPGYSNKAVFATANYFTDIYKNEFRLTNVKLMPAESEGHCDFVSDINAYQDYYLFTLNNQPIFSENLDGNDVEQVLRFFDFILENRKTIAKRGLSVNGCLSLQNTDSLSRKFYNASGFYFSDVKDNPFFGINSPDDRNSFRNLCYDDGHFKFKDDGVLISKRINYLDDCFEITNPIVASGETGFFRLLPDGETKIATYDMRPLARLATTVLPSDHSIIVHYTYTAVSTEKIDSETITLIDMQGGVPVAYHFNAQTTKVTKTSLFVIAFGPEFLEEEQSETAEDARKKALLDPTRIWRTPNDYYSSVSIVDSLPQGEAGFIRADAYESAETEGKPTWFWLNTVANWCTFKKTAANTTELYVWNGSNGWDKFTDIMLNRTKSISKYFYDIDVFTKGATISSVIEVSSAPYSYSTIKLTRDTRFSQYDERSFQTIKINSDKEHRIRMVFTDGIPPIMRLPSGELEVLYTLTVSGYQESEDVVKNDFIPFVNAVCRAYFGAGDEKTIEKDWKKLDKTVEEEAGEVVTDDESTLYAADEINTIKVEEELSISLTVPRQYTETGLILGGDFAERWE